MAITILIRSAGIKGITHTVSGGTNGVAGTDTEPGSSESVAYSRSNDHAE